MAKFNAGVAVERLEYDFTDYGGPEGQITEPSTRKVNEFFKAMKDMMKEAKGLRQAANISEDVDLEALSDEETTALLNQVDEASEYAEALQAKQVENVALLCGAERVICPETEHDCPGYHIVGGSPSLDNLNDLSLRVLQAFTQWLVEEIRPKGKGPAGKR